MNKRYTHFIYSMCYNCAFSESTKAEGFTPEGAREEQDESSSLLLNLSEIVRVARRNY